MNQAQQLKWMRDQIKRSKRWRSQEGFDNDWKRYIDLYRGKQYGSGSTNDQLVVNMIFSTVNTLLPSVAINNPKFTVNARNPDKAPQAVVTEEVLNYTWQTNQFLQDFRLGELDNIIIGHGWLKVGYKFVKEPESKSTDDPSAPNNSESDDDEEGVDDRDPTPGNVESEMTITTDRVFCERISVFDMYVDPDARHPKELAWIAQRTWRPIADVRVDSRYSATARKNVSATSWSRWSDNEGNQDGRDSRTSDVPSKTYVEVYEFYDIKRKQVATFALDGDEQNDASSGFLIKPAKMPYAMGHPFEMLRGYEVPDNFYPIGDVAQLESLQAELNQTRTQMFNHRKKYSRKYLYAKDAFDRDGIAALESEEDNVLIPVTGDSVDTVIVPMPTEMTPPEFYQQSAMIAQDMDRVSSVSDYQRGAAQTQVKRTATEAAMIQDASNSRAQDRLAKVELSLARIGERIIGLMQQYMTGDQVARIVTMPTPAWVNYDADYIAGEFDYSVAAGSTEPQNETFRRQSAMQMVDASMPFMQAGVVNPYGLYLYVLQRGFGVQDPTNLVMPPQQPPMQGGPETAGPQGVQPGGPPGAAPPPPGGPPPPTPGSPGPPGLHAVPA